MTSTTRHPVAVSALMALMALSLVACASKEVAPPTGNSSGLNSQSIESAAEAPLADLNLVRKAIPEVLKQAQHAPYAAPASTNCAALTADVQALDAALGADLDTPHAAGDPGLAERTTAALGTAAANALKSTAEGVVPFRSWVRKLSGAERNAKEVAAAIAAGIVRRAYLKGLGQAGGCAAPAAPLKP